jgi:two-component system, OmpR family, sensor histidine kinase BaeS
VIRGIAIIVMLILVGGGAVSLSFHHVLRTRLSLRIAALILTAGPVALIVLAALNTVMNGSIHAHWWSRLLQVLLIIFGGPLLLGLLAARFVTKPMRRFNEAITSLKESNYQIEMQLTGIREFDTVFTEFNDLIGRLRKEEELRKDLISDTSHELNTPLAAMTSQLTAMQEGVLPITKGRVQTLAQQTERLTSLVSQLNEYTRARAATTITRDEVHFYTFCTEIRDVFASQLEEKGMQLKIECSPSYTIRANRESMERILSNLIQNALRYSGGKTIEIHATKRTLTVRDDGQGVPKESLSYLFERFYRVDASRNRETGGLGLGLAIVRELVQQQGWSIRAENADPGLKFVISL